MATYIKTAEEVKGMKHAGRLAAQVLEMITPHIHIGVTTEELDQRCHDFIVNEQQAIPACLGYKGFPKSICTSINHVVCHGIPSSKKLKFGDILNIDVTVIKDGFHGDTSMMFLLGKPPAYAQRLCNIAKECLYVGIQLVKPRVDLKTIGAAIQQHAQKHRYSSVRDFCGHGIGRDFHEAGFQVLHYDHPTVPSFILEEGMTFTIEPMINAGTHQTRILPDQWTAVTKDRKLSAQWEHTLLVTSDGVDVLTQRSDEQIETIIIDH